MNRSKWALLLAALLCIVQTVMPMTVFAFTAQTPTRVPEIGEAVTVYTKADMVLDFSSYTFSVMDSSGTEQSGTAAAKIGDIETFHKDLDETIAAQSASGILKSYNYLPAANSIWRSVLPYLIVGIALLFVWFILMNRSGGGPNASLSHRYICFRCG